MTKRDLEAALKSEHEALKDIAQENECYTEGKPFINYIEGFYVGDFTTYIYENLRFYKRKKGKEAGKIVALYVNPKTGKSISSDIVIQKFLAHPNPNDTKAISLRSKIFDIGVQEEDVKNHIYEHIVFKLKQNQKGEIAKLRKEKQAK